MVDAALKTPAIAGYPRRRGALRKAIARKSTIAFLMTLPLILLVALCRMAAWGDGEALESTSFPANDAGSTIGDGLRVWSDLDELVYGQRIPPDGVGALAGAEARATLVPAQRRGIASPTR